MSSKPRLPGKDIQCRQVHRLHAAHVADKGIVRDGDGVHKLHVFFYSGERALIDYWAVLPGGLCLYRTVLIISWTIFVDRRMDVRNGCEGLGQALPGYGTVYDAGLIVKRANLFDVQGR